MMNKPYIWVIFLALISVITLECKNNVVEPRRVEGEINIMAANLLCDFLTGEDSGGTWTVISAPGGAGTTLTDGDLVGDCPSIDFDLYNCGDYILRYTVESTTCTGCTDETDLIIVKCCITGSATCS